MFKKMSLYTLLIWWFNDGDTVGDHTPVQSYMYTIGPVLQYISSSLFFFRADRIFFPPRILYHSIFYPYLGFFILNTVTGQIGFAIPQDCYPTIFYPTSKWQEAISRVY